MNTSPEINVYKKRGFTLVEVLVAITILMVALVGPYYAVEQAIMAANIARDQLIASALAQEGVEYFYFVRDNNALNNVNWHSGFGPCGGANGCTVDPTQTTPLRICNSGGCDPLRLSTTGLYTQTGTSPLTRFTRTVKIVAVSTDQYRITVDVTFSTSHQPRTVEVVENLYNWAS